MFSFVPCLVGCEVGEYDWSVGVLGYSSIGEDDVAVRGDDWQRHGRETR